MAGHIDFNSEDAQARLARLFRYGQVGQCVNGVAHDINNMLGAISAYAELVESQAELGPEPRRMLGEIVKGVEKCSALVTAITGIARPEHPTAMVCDLGTLARNMLRIRQYDFQVKRVKVDCRADGLLPSHVVDQPKLEQAIQYVLSNALEAAETADQRLVRLNASARGEAVCIEVWDSAGPIAEADRARMYDPYFTTKGGHHLGMGLPVARATLEAHRGSLEYDPERGFILTVPLETGIQIEP